MDDYNIKIGYFGVFYAVRSRIHERDLKISIPY